MKEKKYRFNIHKSTVDTVNNIILSQLLRGVRALTEPPDPTAKPINSLCMLLVGYACLYQPLSYFPVFHPGLDACWFIFL